MTLAFIQTLADDFSALKTKIEDYLSNTVEPEVVNAGTAVVDVVKVWASQFETDFGKAALVAVGTVIVGFSAGGFPAVPALAEAAGALLLSQGIAIAEKDAQTVILNAARTAYNAIPTVTENGELTVAAPTDVAS